MVLYHSAKSLNSIWLCTLGILQQYVTVEMTDPSLAHLMGLIGGLTRPRGPRVLDCSVNLSPLPLIVFFGLPLYFLSRRSLYIVLQSKSTRVSVHQSADLLHSKPAVWSTGSTHSIGTVYLLLENGANEVKTTSTEQWPCTFGQAFKYKHAHSETSLRMESPYPLSNTVMTFYVLVSHVYNLALILSSFPLFKYLLVMRKIILDQWVSLSRSERFFLRINLWKLKTGVSNIFSNNIK